MIIKIVNGVMSATPENEYEAKLLLNLPKKTGRPAGSKNERSVDGEERVYPMTRKRFPSGYRRDCAQCDAKGLLGRRGLAIHMSKEHGYKSPKHHKDAVGDVDSLNGPKQ